MSAVVPLRVLVLGGTSEASALVRALRDNAGISTTLSLAGRTRAVPEQPVPTRIGGFGGIDGLVAYLRDEEIDLLVDATHPFAAQMSRHAREAAKIAGCPLVVVGRRPWAAQDGDDWHEVADMAAAAQALGADPRRVFLTVGRLQLAAFEMAPQHAYVVRTIEPIDPSLRLPHLETIEARGPFDVEAEERLIADRHIDVLVTKNSGGAAAWAKLDAARRLRLPVIMVRRPSAEQGVGVDEALSIIAAHRGAAERGV